MPSEHTTVLEPCGTTTVVFFAGGGGLLLLMQPETKGAASNRLVNSKSLTFTTLPRGCCVIGLTAVVSAASLPLDPGSEKYR